MPFFSTSEAGSARVDLTAYAAYSEVIPIPDTDRLVIGLAVPIKSPNSLTIALTKAQAADLLRKLSDTLGPEDRCQDSP